MKPLARWTIGPVEPIGHEILKLSLRIFQQIYPEFDVVVCYNNIDCPNVGVKCINQNELAVNFKPSKPDEDYSNRSGGMQGSGWKLVPPRLRIDSHELWIDNDIVILQRIEEIDRWLSDGTGIISEGLGRHYGKFGAAIGDLKLCAGFFGLPPGYDLAEQIKILNGDSELGGFDEQGLVAYSVSEIKDCIIVPQSQLKIVEDHHEFPIQKPKGYHFVGANRKNWHRGWKSFKTSLQP